MKNLRIYTGVALFGLFVAADRMAAQPAQPAPAAAGTNATTAKAADAGSGPLIKFDSKEYNFGKAESGDLIKHVFTVTNTGTLTLEITNVHPSCGCTTAGSWTRQIEPGQTGTIPIQFNSARYSSSVTKSIDVYSNAKDHPRETLFLKGTIWKPIDVSPQTVILNLLPDSTNSVTGTTMITNKSDKPIDVSLSSTSSKSFTATLTTNSPGREYQLVVTAVPPFTVGNTPGTVSLKTSLPSTPILNVNVIVKVQPEVQVSPPQLTLGVMPKVWTTNRVIIRGNSSTPLSLSDPVSSDTRLTAQITPVGPKGMFTLMIGVPPDYKIDPSQKVEISIKSNNPRVPVVKVPVVQSPRSASRARPGSPSVPFTQVVSRPGVTLPSATAVPAGQVQQVPQTASHP
jgi:hypothetical protein